MILIYGNSAGWLEHAFGTAKQNGIRLLNKDYPLPEDCSALKSTCCRAAYSDTAYLRPARLLRPLCRRWFLKNTPGDEPVSAIVVMDHHKPAFDRKWLSALRRRYPDAAIYYMFTDLVRTSFLLKHLTLTEASGLYDALLTFDQEDAKKNGITYLEFPYEPIRPVDSPEICYDVTYVGYAKVKKESERFAKILRAFTELKAKGYRLNFYIMNVPEEQQQYADEIHYNHYLSYGEVIQEVQKSKAILEILQSGQHQSTLRLKEALTYGKLLITNNTFLRNEPYYNADDIYIIESDAAIALDLDERMAGYVPADTKRFSLAVFAQHLARIGSHENGGKDA